MFYCSSSLDLHKWFKIFIKSVNIHDNLSQSSHSILLRRRTKPMPNWKICVQRTIYRRQCAENNGINFALNGHWNSKDIPYYWPNVRLTCHQRFHRRLTALKSHIKGSLDWSNTYRLKSNKVWIYSSKKWTNKRENMYDFSKQTTVTNDRFYSLQLAVVDRSVEISTYACVS